MSMCIANDNIFVALADGIRNGKGLPKIENVPIYGDPIMVQIPDTIYDGTKNVNLETGSYSNGYGDNISFTHVITAPNATNIHVKITYQTENTTYDWACLWEGNHPEYTAMSDFSTSLSGKLGGSTLAVQEYDIEGDTVTIAFRSDSSNSSYLGYKAEITGGYHLEEQIPIIGYEERPVNRLYMPEIISGVLNKKVEVMQVTPTTIASSPFVSEIDLTALHTTTDAVALYAFFLGSTTSSTYYPYILGKSIPDSVYNSATSEYKGLNAASLSGSMYTQTPIAQGSVYILDDENKIRFEMQGGTAANKSKNPIQYSRVALMVGR